MKIQEDKVLPSGVEIIARGNPRPEMCIPYRGIELRHSNSSGRSMAMIIDFDSHLREGYSWTSLQARWSLRAFQTVKLNDGRTHGTKFLHSPIHQPRPPRT